MMPKIWIILICLLWAMPASASPNHGAAIWGNLKYPPKFQHLDYVNPDAPKGGKLVMGSVGTFNSLNPFILTGVPASGLRLIYDSLLENVIDEPFSEYGLLAERTFVADDNSSVTFVINKSAKWHDGKPVTADDVAWTYQTLVEKGNPFYKAYYNDVKSAEIINDRTITFHFKVTTNRELPLILGQMMILPKHYWQDKDFSKTTTAPPLGSGPYSIESLDTGRRITYRRTKDYWGKDLPINRGRHNFNQIIFDYYRDGNVLHQAFLAGDIDFKREDTAKTWATGYNSPALDAGKIILKEQSHKFPSGMQGFVYNLRRHLFQDIELRKALAYAFDFEWSNKAFAYNSYTRTKSFFDNSELAATGLPSEKELKILNKHRGHIPNSVFTEPYMPPKTDEQTSLHDNLVTAQNILLMAGYKLNQDQLYTPNGKAVKFEILLNNPAFKRWVLPMIGNLKRLGVDANLRIVDTAQYQNRLRDYDFDMTIGSFPQSNSPGNEQRDFWGSKKADLPGSRNITGIKNPAIDNIIEDLTKSQTREELVLHTKTLDRALQHLYILIPQWHSNVFKLAFWHHLRQPETPPEYGLGVLDTWWVKKE